MQQVNQLEGEKIGSSFAGTVLDIGQIPALKHPDAHILARVELERFISLVELLQPEEWILPTACTLWTVKDIVAHQAAHAQDFTGDLRDLMRATNRKSLRPYQQKGMNSLDALNQYAVDQRRDRSPAQLIAELHGAGPRAIERRDKTSRFVRFFMRLPTPGVGLITFGYLLDVILSRDMWMHRLDICRTTGRDMVMTTEHDGRMIALIMRDLGRNLQAKLGDRSIEFSLSGSGGGRWRMGHNPQVAATIHMDVLEFCVLNSGRLTAEQVLAEKLVSIDGDHEFGQFILENSLVLY